MGRAGLKRCVTVLGVAALAALGFAAPASAAGPACSVKNTTLTKSYAGNGTALTKAITAARDGDSLTVLGTCAGSYFIDKDLVLNGNMNEKKPTVLDGRRTGRVLAVDFEATVVLNDLTITRGVANVSGGGGIANQGDLTLIRSSVVDNHTPDSGGGIMNGGIMNGGIIEITRSYVGGNSSVYDGGGIFNYGNVTTYRAVIAHNETVGAGGGMSTEGPAWMHNSLVTANTAGDCGGGVVSVNTLELDNTQVVGNAPDDTC